MSGVKTDVRVPGPNRRIGFEIRKENEREIDVTKLASKLASTLVAYGHRTPATVPFVPQLEGLRREYAGLEEEGYGVDERDAAGDASANRAGGGRKRLRLYDAP